MKSAAPPRDDLARGAVFMVASALCFAGMGLAVKLSSLSLPSPMVVFFRNAMGLLFLLPLAIRLGPRNLGTAHLREHVVRSLAGLGAMYCFFYAIAHMKLADAVIFNYSLPLFMPLVERFWQDEPIAPRLWWGIGVGFVGILLILKPGLGLFQPVALVALGAALLGAVAQVGVRRLTRTEPAIRIVFYFGVISTLVSALPLLGAWRRPEPRVWLVLVAMGLMATLGQLLLTRAYAEAPAGRVGPFLYSSVVFAAVLDWWFWAILPDLTSVAGALLVCAAGILALRVRELPRPA